MHSVRRLTADDWSDWRRLRREALREASDAFSASLAEWSGKGDTETRWRSRLDAVPVNFVADLDEVSVGMVSLTTVLDHEAEVISMWVAPQARGLGVGDALIGSVLDVALDGGALTVSLNVMLNNKSAIALYERSGFVDAGWATGPDHPRPERRMVFQAGTTTTSGLR